MISIPRICHEMQSMFCSLLSCFLIHHGTSHFGSRREPTTWLEFLLLSVMWIPVLDELLWKVLSFKHRLMERSEYRILLNHVSDFLLDLKHSPS